MNFKLLRSMICLVCLFLMMSILPTEVKAEEYLGEETYYAETETYVVSNPYFGGWRNCTWSAWQLAYEYTGIALPAWGSAGNWFYNAQAQGWTVSNVPQAGSIVVWSSHVGYVAAVSEDGSMVYIIEGGYLGGYHEGWFPAYVSRSSQRLYGYIYLW